MSITDNLPSDKRICMLCGARFIDGSCPNGCNIPTMEIDDEQAE